MEHTGQSSELVELAKRAGDFKRHYGTSVGAFLYLRSLSAARRRPYYWLGLICAVVATALPWLTKLGWLLPNR